MRRLLLLAVLCLPLSPALADKFAGPETVSTRPLSGWSERGTASYYGRGDGFHGRKTASGVTFDTMAPMCAHKSLPFNTMVRVTSLESGRQTWCIVKDRGPFIRGRVIDLSVYSARQLGMVEQGTAPVRLEAVR